jgi:hypothetical protein
MQSQLKTMECKYLANLQNARNRLFKLVHTSKYMQYAEMLTALFLTSRKCRLVLFYNTQSFGGKSIVYLAGPNLLHFQRFRKTCLIFEISI